MSSWKFAIGLLVLLYVSAGCGSKADVTLSGSVRDPELSAVQGALGTALGGSFTLVLQVGSRASGASSATLEQIVLIDQDDGNVLVQPLEAASDTPFPLEVEPGSSRNIQFTISDSNFVDTAVGGAVCDGLVAIRLVLTDSLLEGQTLTLTSPAIAPACS